ncbi:MAG: Bug family tripartite tricarboxylate transporter substrate binding protein [Burkholderiales bacterium]
MRAPLVAWLVSIFLIPASLLAQTYPSKPIRLIFPTIPGSAFELYGRVLAQKMGETLGRPVIGENRPGANGAIGVDLVAKAPPDGYTILWTTPAMMVTPVYVVKSLPFDPQKDFTPISIGAEPLTVMVINPNQPFSSVRELVDHGKRNPGKLSFGSSGTGSVFHLMGAAFNQASGLDMTHVPYKGPPAALNDVMGGRVEATFVTLGTAHPLWKSGKLKVIALLAEKRYFAAPEIPTFREVLPSYDVPTSWYALFGNAGTPRPIIMRLYTEMAAAVKSKESQAWLDQYFHTGVGNTPEEFAQVYRRDFESWGKAVKAAGVQPE